MYTRVSMIIMSVITFACSSEQKSFPPTTTEVIENYISFLGGSENLARIETRTVWGTWTDNRPYLGEPRVSHFTLHADGVGRWRFDSDYESYGRDDHGSWWLEKGTIRSDTSRRNLREEFLLMPGAALNLERYFQGLQTGRSVMIDGSDAIGLITERDTTHYTLWIEPETGKLVRIGNYWSVSDYRLQDGVRMPFHIERSRKGGATILQIDSVKQNQVIADSLLTRPSGYPSV